MKVLIHFSGGIDSTYTLARALKETEYEIVVNHTIMKNKENRWEKESEAVAKLLPKLQAIRPFKEWYIEHDYRRSAFGIPPYDMALMCADAGVISKAYHLEGDGPIEIWTIGTNKEEGHWNERFNVIVESARAFAWETDVAHFRFLFKLEPRHVEMKYLHDLGLLKDTWSCRWPQGDEPCGKCTTCQAIAQATIKAFTPTENVVQ